MTIGAVPLQWETIAAILVNLWREQASWDAILLCAHYGRSMTIYTIIPSEDGSSYNIGIAGSNGARQTMLGFASEAEAEAWISQDKRLDAAPNTHTYSAAAD